MELSSSLSRILIVGVLFFYCVALSSSTEVSYDSRAIKIDGKRRLLLSGAIHYPRSTPEMWPDLIRKSKEGGLNAIETYVFWNAHEPERRQYDFEGNLDLVRFLKEIQNAGMYAILRIGPYVCAEWNYGGLPVWLRDIPGMEYRTDNEPFKIEMEKFTKLIVDMVKEHNLLAPQGGPIIITQIENEYGNVQKDYGDAGKRYINWAAKMADSLKVGVPWIMCQQGDAPQPMINTCNGFYCNEFNPNNKKSPKMWTENWTGWFKAWGSPDEHRPTEDVAYSVARFFQSNGTFQNYYMYHGGTNFGRTTGGPYIVTSYDYDAPLDEYGNTKQPKWGHLKNLHMALYEMEDALLHGEVKWTDLGNGLSVTRFSGEGINPACFLTNKNNLTDATIDFEGRKYYVPAWSMSLLPGCKKEVYNTAKITAQTTNLVKKGDNGRTSNLIWYSQPEVLDKPLQGLGGFRSDNKLLEQIRTSLDTSDYLWYMTSVDNTNNETNMTLSVNTTGHVLHAFVNGKLIGSQYSTGNPNYTFVFNRSVPMKPGKNSISLLSATVGLKNYGARYELLPAGIVDGPVKLIGSKSTIDLSKARWSYKVGLDGLAKGPSSFGVESWDESDDIPINKPFTWYQANFDAPLGSEPVVVDLLGMGKGEAWINGKSIGRYWPSFITSKEGCGKCDYRGEFKAGKCLTGCNEPSQRWYHVPRSYLKAGENNYVTLFEEAGGNPKNVNFKNVVVGTICGKVPEGKTLTLSCQGYGRTISEINFAGFGDMKGSCDSSFQKGECDTEEILSSVKKVCLGKESCIVDASESFFGDCHDCDEGFLKTLAIQATCSGAA